MDSFESLYKIEFLDSEKLKETLLLIEECFEYPEGYSFKEDFAPLFTEKNINNCRLLIEKDSQKIIGHIGVSKRNLLVDAKAFPVSFLGGICIHKDFQGKGLFKKFFQIVLKQIEAKTPLSFLWSGDPSIYYKYGFHLCALQASTNLEALYDSNSKYQLIKEPSDQDWIIVKESYDNFILNKNHSIQRSENEWDTIKNIHSTNLYINYEDNSYFFINKGADLKDTIHELAIDNIEKFKSPIKQGNLWYPSQLNLEAEKTQFATIARVNGEDLFKKFIEHLSGGHISIEKIDNTNNLITFYFEGYLQEISINDFLCGIWGPGSFEEFNKFIKPLYICGLDSI
jgi:predicted N-acetyltransferase YhbS